jgi:hypothetical protein
MEKIKGDVFRLQATTRSLSRRKQQCVTSLQELSSRFKEKEHRYCLRIWRKANEEKRYRQLLDEWSSKILHEKKRYDGIAASVLWSGDVKVVAETNANIEGDMGRGITGILRISPVGLTITVPRSQRPRRSRGHTRSQERRSLAYRDTWAWIEMHEDNYPIAVSVQASNMCENANHADRKSPSSVECRTAAEHLHLHTISVRFADIKKIHISSQQIDIHIRKDASSSSSKDYAIPASDLMESQRLSLSTWINATSSLKASKGDDTPNALSADDKPTDSREENASKANWSTKIKDLYGCFGSSFYLKKLLTSVVNTCDSIAKDNVGTCQNDFRGACVSVAFASRDSTDHLLLVSILKEHVPDEVVTTDGTKCSDADWGADGAEGLGFGSDGSTGVTSGEGSNQSNLSVDDTSRCHVSKNHDLCAYDHASGDPRPFCKHASISEGDCTSTCNDRGSATLDILSEFVGHEQVVTCTATITEETGMIGSTEMQCGGGAYSGNEVKRMETALEELPHNPNPHPTVSLPHGDTGDTGGTRESPMTILARLRSLRVERSRAQSRYVMIISYTFHDSLL